MPRVPDIEWNEQVRGYTEADVPGYPCFDKDGDGRGFDRSLIPVLQASRGCPDQARRSHRGENLQTRRHIKRNEP